jgi:hypothetical protein
MNTNQKLSWRNTWIALGISETELLRLVDAGRLTPIKDETNSENKMHWTFLQAEVLAVKESL